VGSIGTRGGCIIGMADMWYIIFFIGLFFGLAIKSRMDYKRGHKKGYEAALKHSVLPLKRAHFTAETFVTERENNDFEVSFMMRYREPRTTEK